MVMRNDCRGEVRRLYTQAIQGDTYGVRGLFGQPKTSERPERPLEFLRQTLDGADGVLLSPLDLCLVSQSLIRYLPPVLYKHLPNLQDMGARQG